MRYLLLQVLLIFLTFTDSSSQRGEVFFTPTLPAPGEDATLHCYFFSSPNMTFLSALPTFFIQSVTVGITAVRESYTVNGVDLSRYSATVSSSSSARYIKANLTLHGVTKQDEGVQMGCSAQTTFLSRLTKLLAVNVSEPPQPVDAILRSTLNPTTCLTTLYWDAPYSDRDITSYHILRDQQIIHTNPPHLLSYAIADGHPMGKTRSYAVIPESAAGRAKGQSPLLNLYIPQFQFDEVTLRVENGTENHLNWTLKEPYPDPVTVSYRLELAEETLTKHSYAFSAGTDDNRYSFTGVDGNQFILTLSAYRVCDQPLATSIRANERVATASVGADTVWIITGAGTAFVLLWVGVLVVFSCVCCFPRKRRVTHI